MPTLSPRRLDRGAESRWPWLFEYRDTFGPLYLATAFLVAALVLVLMGEPYSFGAGGCIGGALGLNVRVLRDARRKSKGKSQRN